MKDYEKLGVFYLGRDYDLATRKLKDRLVLYDSKDLTTHGVIIGMTGSGKTGLGIALIEEALIDGVPVIAVDPKGDLSNLLLSFPELRAEDFRCPRGGTSHIQDDGDGHFFWNSNSGRLFGTQDHQRHVSLAHGNGNEIGWWDAEGKDGCGQSPADC
jgi:hypothetical protein